MRLKEKTILITGAAGQLGKRLAQALASEGAMLWLADLSPERLTVASSAIPSRQLLGNLIMDVSQPSSVREAFVKVSDYGSPLDVLVNNAGIGVFTPFWERKYDEFMNVMSVNVGGVFLCTREALLLMKDAGQGSVINIGSVYGVVSSDPRIYTDCSRMNSEAYSASKAAVIQMTRYFAVHAAPFGVRVNCVSPGGIFNYQGEDFLRNYSQRAPMNRMASEHDICGAVVFFASPEASYVSGQNLVIDGGLTAW